MRNVPLKIRNIFKRHPMLCIFCWIPMTLKKCYTTWHKADIYYGACYYCNNCGHDDCVAATYRKEILKSKRNPWWV